MSTPIVEDYDDITIYRVFDDEMFRNLPLNHEQRCAGCFSKIESAPASWIVYNVTDYFVHGGECEQKFITKDLAKLHEPLG